MRKYALPFLAALALQDATKERNIILKHMNPRTWLPESIRNAVTDVLSMKNNKIEFRSEVLDRFQKEYLKAAGKQTLNTFSYK